MATLIFYLIILFCKKSVSVFMKIQKLMKQNYNKFIQKIKYIDHQRSQWLSTLYKINKLFDHNYDKNGSRKGYSKSFGSIYPKTTTTTKTF